jgi:hypothetical protein
LIDIFKFFKLGLLNIKRELTMKNLFIAFLAISSITNFTGLQASHEPPCNHESIEEALNNEDNKSKDDNHCGHHHHCG